MTEGARKERKEPAPPSTVHCDFCGKPFCPPKWASRTCYHCSSRGMPDQGGELSWEAYERINLALQRGSGLRDLPRGAAKGSLLSKQRKGAVHKRRKP